MGEATLKNKIYNEGKLNCMNNIRVRYMTRTGVLLALAIVFQMAGRFLGPHNNYIVGPLINAILLVSTAATGLWGGIAISVIAPYVSAFTNKAPIAPFILSFSPFIALGNAILVLCFFLLYKKSKVAGVAVGAILKFIFLYASVALFTSFFGVPDNFAKIMNALFSWPQLLTAAIGGIIALIIIKLLGRNIELK